MDRSELAVKRSVFKNLLLSMIAFGIFVGIVFPPFAAIVLNSDRAISVQFFAMCIFAGFFVGLVNYILFRSVVSRELARVGAGMKEVVKKVTTAETVGQGRIEECVLLITSNDAIGEIERSFNLLAEAISRRLSLEYASRSFNMRLSASVELQDVSSTILMTLSEVCGAKAGLLYGDKGDSFELLNHFGIDQNERILKNLDLSQGPISHALFRGNIESISTERHGLMWIELSTPLGSFKPSSVILLPLVAKQQPVGLAILAYSSPELSSELSEILETLRVQAAAYLQNAILHRKVTDLAAIDDLTRILNRRFGLRRLHDEFSRSVRHGVPLSVFLVDIDHFKQFNDSFGHDAGDKVLKVVASVLESNLRAGDVVCRYGGEEFMIVAPGTGLNDGAIVGERLRRIIETTQVTWGVQNFTVNVSMGLATWPMVRASTPEEIVNAADKALYSAKEYGRNQVAVCKDDKVLPLSSLEMAI